MCCEWVRKREREGEARERLVKRIKRERDSKMERYVMGGRVEKGTLMLEQMNQRICTHGK